MQVCVPSTPAQMFHMLRRQLGDEQFKQAIIDSANSSIISTDPDGVIQGYEVLTPPVGRNVMETIRQVQAFQLIRGGRELQLQERSLLKVLDAIGGEDCLSGVENCVASHGPGAAVDGQLGKDMADMFFDRADGASATGDLQHG